MKNAVPKNDKKRRKQLVEDVAKLEREMEQRHREELEQLKLAFADSKVWGTPLVSEPWESRLNLANSLLCASTRLMVESRHAATPTHHSSSLLVFETKCCVVQAADHQALQQRRRITLNFSSYWLGLTSPGITGMHHHSWLYVFLVFCDQIGLFIFLR